MNPREKFREAVEAAFKTATAAGAEPAQLQLVLLRFAGLDLDAAREAAESLDQLIDGEEDALAEQLAPARNILRQIAGG